MNIVRLFGCLAPMLVGAYAIPAMAWTFTDRAAFISALPGPAGVLTFDALPGGADLSGVTLNVTGGPGIGILFPASVLDGSTELHLQTVVGDPTTSPANSLGTADPANFNAIVAGTFIDLTLTASVNALGLSFITAEELVDDDLRLIAGTETAALAAGDATLIGTFGGNPYYAHFLGIVSVSPFGAASIRYGSGTDGAFLYNADDLTVAAAGTSIPVAGTPLLILGGGLILVPAAGPRKCGAPVMAGRNRRPLDAL